MNKVRLKRGEKVPALLISVFFLLFYVFFQSSSIYGGDAGDVVTAAYVRGVAHPPGYPLYTFVGWLLTKLPISTVAWRVTLLSSIPAALSLSLLYLLIFRLTQNRLSAILSTGILGFSYLFWLYAITPEVFALHVFLSLLLIHFAFRFSDTGKVKFLYLAALVLGLELAHHHTVVLILPGVGLLIYKRFSKLTQKFKRLLITCLFLATGLLPYLYVWWAATGNPPVNWENPQTLAGFIRLVNRTIYGTFRAGPEFGLEPIERYYQLKLMSESFFIDFSRLGVFLGLLGAVLLFFRNRRLFWVTLLLFGISGPVFMFYAAFPTVLNFHLGTTERFLLLPYTLFVLWIGYSMAVLSNTIDRLLKRVLHGKQLLPSSFIFALIPVFFLGINISRLLPLKHDRTAEQLASDIFTTLPDRAIFLPADDTSFFNTQYLYYTGGGMSQWRDIKIIQLGAVGMSFYTNIIVREYPQLKLAEIAAQSKDAASFLEKLVTEYYGTYPIFSGLPLNVGPDYGWLRVGLLYRLYKTAELEKVSRVEYREMNEKLFSAYQDPLAGALGSYLHVMLGDVLRIYATARREVATSLVKVGEVELAEKYFREALRLQPEFPENRNSLAGTLVLLHKCGEAKDLLSDMPETAYIDANTYRILAIVAKECDKDEAKAEEYDKLYQENASKDAVKLKTF